MTVMHVANNPVSGALGQSDDEMDSDTTNSGLLSLSLDINLFYPNPLYGNDTYIPFSPQKGYEGGEYFKYFVSKDKLAESTDTVAHETFFTWERTS